ncbi:MAG: RNA polymerase subunit sigma-24 [Acidobacteria bacterium]|nr:MAG: RNA polymerase subunit sigma-24 [Acidobacteriota bacterium]PIE89708.1 MAG: RNA polymerase subunit sigma-24 [Acidobacteriota bacterium]
MLMTEKAQIEKAIQGNARAWEKLVRKHEKTIFNTSLRLTGNREDALDLTQEVFFEVYRRLPQFRHQSSFSTWVQKISYGKAIDFLRRLKPTSELKDSIMIDERTPQSQLEEREANKSILTYLSRLAPEQRLIIELKFYHDMTFQEISLEMNCSENTIKSRFYSALKKMKTKREAQNVLPKI